VLAVTVAAAVAAVLLVDVGVVVFGDVVGVA
jgi:hypothetical protein